MESKNLKIGEPACFIPERIVSGGAHGADLIPFKLVESLEGSPYDGLIKTGGFVPKGYSDKDDQRELAEKYGLVEVERDSYPDRDMANEKFSDGLIAFIKPSSREKKYGKGSMQTASLFLYGIYRFLPDKSFLEASPPFPVYGTDICCTEYGPKKRNIDSYGNKPVFFVWNLQDDNWSTPVSSIRNFLNTNKPKTLMISGSTSEVETNITENGVKLLRMALFNLE